MQNFITWFFYFTIYAFLGYICEVVYVAIITKKITNRGYLFGPIVPIYGYGAIIVLLSLWSLRNNPFLISTKKGIKFTLLTGTLAPSKLPEIEYKYWYTGFL